MASPSATPMNTPSSVPPAPLLRPPLGSRTAAARALPCSLRALMKTHYCKKSHLLRCADAEDGETVSHRLPGRRGERETRAPQSFVVDQETLGIIVTME